MTLVCMSVDYRLVEYVCTFVLCAYCVTVYSANISRAINFADFTVSLQSVKIISAKMNGRL